jgi:hypothetical protein
VSQDEVGDEFEHYIAIAERSFRLRKEVYVTPFAYLLHEPTISIILPESPQIRGFKIALVTGSHHTSDGM